MHRQALGGKGPAAVWAGLKLSLTWPLAGYKGLRLLWRWPAELPGELAVFYFPLFQAFGLMNRKGEGAKFPATNVADESPWSRWDATSSFLKTRKVTGVVALWLSGPTALGLAASLVDNKAVRQECAATDFAGQQLGLRALERCLVQRLERVGPIAAGQRLWLGGFWPPLVLGQLAVFNPPLLQALGLMNGEGLGPKFSAADIAYPESRPAGRDHGSGRLAF